VHFFIISLNFAGGDDNAGKNLKAKSGWTSYEGKSGNGTDIYGFSALPGGLGGTDGSFDNVGKFGYWWSSGAYSRRMDCHRETAIYGEYGKSSLQSVRCLQD